MAKRSLAPKNPFAAWQVFLCERLRAIIATLHPALRCDVERVLSEKGKLLSPTDDLSSSPVHPAGTWALLTLLVALHVDPNINLAKAADVALAVECFVCALDLLDDVEDEDQTPVVQELGAALVLNVSTSLIALAVQFILSLRLQKASPALVLRLMKALQECLIEAATGQHRDLLAEQRPLCEFTREECVEIAAGKAGAIMRFACLTGAICAGAKKSISEQFAQLGTVLGIAHQLDNDAHDMYDLLHQAISPDEGVASYGSIKSDLARGKKTLPIVLAALSLTEEHRRGNVPPEQDNLYVALKNFSELSDNEKEEYRRMLNEGILATWGISLLYRERAYELMREIEAHKPIDAEFRLLLGFK